MSEKLHQNHEKLEAPIDASAESRRNLERIHKAAQEAETLPHAEQARHQAHHEAISGKDISLEQKPATESHNFMVEKELKTHAYQKTLQRIRSQLSPGERVLSKVTHNPTVDKASAITGRTIARPTGILGGSICALLGSILLIYTSKKYGFTYNYLLFILLFIGGYLLGSAIELLLWLIAGRRKQRLS